MQAQLVHQARHFERLARWVDDYWPSLLTPVSGALMALFVALATSEHGYRTLWFVCFVASGVFTVIGAVAELKNARRTSAIEVENASLKAEVEASRSVFLLLASLSEEWQLELTQKLLNEFSRNGFHPVVFAPTKSYSGEEQDAYLREILSRRQSYRGGIIVPVIPETHCDELQHFTETFKGPLVFVDNFPYDLSAAPHAFSSFVGISSQDGGNLAAEAAVSYATHRNVELNRVLVVCGNTQGARQQAFRDSLVQAFPYCTVMSAEVARYDRDTARRLVEREIKFSCESTQPFQLIFCTSDSLTLGCLEALTAVRDWQGVTRPVVIGYDGVEATKELARNEESLLWQVVVQDTHDIAIAALDQLLRSLSGQEHVPEKWIKPYLYP